MDTKATALTLRSRNLAQVAPSDSGGIGRLLRLFRTEIAESFLAQHSGHTHRAYQRHVQGFLNWLEASGYPRIDRESLGAYKGQLEREGLSPATINQALSAVRGLVREASELGALDPRLAESIARVKGPRQHGQRLGKWISRAEAQEILDRPPDSTLKGLRDRAMLALLFGCGLRRSEVSAITWDQIQERDGHHVLADIRGKHGRIRTVKLPPWVWRRIIAWGQAAAISEGPILRSLRKGESLNGDSLTPQAVRNVIKDYAPELAPHDARRTFAKLARKGGAPLEQIQLTLGHASVATTERYLGLELDLDQSAVDFTGLQDDEGP